MGNGQEFGPQFYLTFTLLTIKSTHRVDYLMHMHLL